MGFCDGAVRFIRNTIDGTVYSKIITPAGSKLPLYCKQMPVVRMHSPTDRSGFFGVCRSGLPVA